MTRFHSLEDCRIRGRRRAVHREYSDSGRIEMHGRLENWRNRHPRDCGRAACCVCSWGKIMEGRGRGYQVRREEERCELQLREAGQA